MIAFAVSKKSESNNSFKYGSSMDMNFGAAKGAYFS
jgi:hypothetical protein